MVRYHLRMRARGWRRRAVISSIGALATLFVLGIVTITRFKAGAWLSIVVVGAIMALFISVKRHYDHLDESLKITPSEVRPAPMNHTVVVLVGRVHRGVVKALQYARSLRPNHLAAVYIAEDDADRERIQAEGEEFRFDVPLEIVHSPYRDLTGDVERYLDELDRRWDDDTVTVVIPRVRGRTPAVAAAASQPERRCVEAGTALPTAVLPVGITV